MAERAGDSTTSRSIQISTQLPKLEKSKKRNTASSRIGTNALRRNTAYKKKMTSLQEMNSFERPDSSIILAYREYHKAVNKEKYKNKLLRGLTKKSSLEERTNKQILGTGQPITKHIPDGITDVDKNYFKIIQVRSKHKTKKLNRHQYLTDINNCLRQNIITGYFYDEMFKIDQQFETEKIKIVKIKDNFQKFSTYFEMFLDDDHKESMDLMAASVRETNETEKRRNILRRKQERLGKIRNEIYGFEEIYERTLSCAAFILSITPDDFYDNTEGKKSDTMRRISSSSTHSLDDLEKQLEEVKKLKPKLYFKDPWDVFQLFRDIEVQNLKFMLHTLEFKAKIQEQSALINSLKIFSENELYNIRYKVNKTEMAITNIELQTKNLEERCKNLLEQEYKEFVSGNESLLIHAYVAETYAYVMGTEPDDNLETILTELGQEYKRLKFQADNVPSKLLNKVLTSVYNTTQQRKIKAKIAIRRLTDFDILINRTLKLLDKPAVPKRRKLMTRSPVTSKPKPKPKPPPPISEEELLQLYLFTDTCRPQNPAIEIDHDEEPIH